MGLTSDVRALPAGAGKYDRSWKQFYKGFATALTRGIRSFDLSHDCGTGIRWLHVVEEKATSSYYPVYIRYALNMPLPCKNPILIVLAFVEISSSHGESKFNGVTFATWRPLRVFLFAGAY